MSLISTRCSGQFSASNETCSQLLVSVACSVDTKGDLVVAKEVDVNSLDDLDNICFYVTDHLMIPYDCDVAQYYEQCSEGPRAWKTLNPKASSDELPDYDISTGDDGSMGTSNTTDNKSSNRTSDNDDRNNNNGKNSTTNGGGKNSTGGGGKGKGGKSDDDDDHKKSGAISSIMSNSFWAPFSSLVVTAGFLVLI